MSSVRPTKTRTRRSDPSHIPRPRNAWIIYRSETIKLLTENGQLKGAMQAEVSRCISNLWKNEPEDVKSWYYEQAEIEKKNHALKYPNYKYTPRRSKGSSPQSTIQPSASFSNPNLWMSAVPQNLIAIEYPFLDFHKIATPVQAPVTDVPNSFEDLFWPWRQDMLPSNSTDTLSFPAPHMYDFDARRGSYSSTISDISVDSPVLEPRPDDQLEFLLL